jgi:alkanesulfonate monooxygenase SsuD/methylene tetrahydromethanopterin reductase-like flavin-dependent oxidoreductase (luciferase family)
MPFERRGARCNSYVKAIQRLWCDPISEYHDEFYNLEPCRMYPKPIQDPHPPIYFGGESDAALRRVAELGQGWYGLGITPDDLPPLLAKLEKFLAEKGRGLADIEVAVSPYFKGCDRDNLERYRDLGVDQVIVPGLVPELGISLETIEPSLERLAKELVEPALSF